jgi:hypothetical protein
VTDDADRPRPGQPGADDDAPTRPFRPGFGAGDEGPAAEAFRWSPEAADADYADEAVSRASGWSLSAEDDDSAAQPFGWDDDATRAPAEPPPVDPSLDGAPASDGQPPTEAMAWETAVVPEVAPGGPLPRDAADPPTGPTGIDTLFQPGQFRDFEPTTVLPREPRPAGATAIRDGRTRPSLTSTQRSLLWAAGVLVAILVLLALFAIGRRLPAMFAAPPAPVATVTPTPTPTPEPVDPAAGPLPPGEYAWDELRGGECIDPYESAWREDYTVVDCDDEHAAQLLVRAEFPEDAAPGGAYPGFDELAGRINLLCTDPQVIDYDAAREFDDIVVEGAHAVTPEEWDEGHHDYFCFLERSSGDPLAGSLAVPRE